MSDERREEFENQGSGVRNPSLLEMFDHMVLSLPRAIRFALNSSRFDRKLPSRKRP